MFDAGKKAPGQIHLSSYGTVHIMQVRDEYNILLLLLR